jgi:hypothetical protein
LIAQLFASVRIKKTSSKIQIGGKMPAKKYPNGGFILILMYFIRHFFICRPSYSTVSVKTAWDQPMECCDFGIGSQTL